MNTPGAGYYLGIWYLLGISPEGPLERIASPLDASIYRAALAIQSHYWSDEGAVVE